jgi:hypothetical protein
MFRKNEEFTMEAPSQVEDQGSRQFFDIRDLTAKGKLVGDIRQLQGIPLDSDSDNSENQNADEPSLWDNKDK